MLLAIVSGTLAVVKGQLPLPGYLRSVGFEKDSISLENNFSYVVRVDKDPVRCVV